MSDVAAPDTLDVRYVRSATFSLVALCILSLAKQKIQNVITLNKHHLKMSNNTFKQLSTFLPNNLPTIQPTNPPTYNSIWCKIGHVLSLLTYQPMNQPLCTSTTNHRTNQLTNLYLVHLLSLPLLSSWLSFLSS